ncbi:MAG: CRISPR-associated endonuclease Cas2 [Patescibacteria group bacterium]
MAKKILRGVATAGLIILAAQSPLFAARLWKGIFHEFKEGDRKERKRLYDAFTYLMRQGMLKVRYKNNQMFISLTAVGKKRVGKDDIDTLAIMSPRRWDGKWRILLFDVPTRERSKREALRGKLIELGFTMLQKSVWVHPYECSHEVQTLKRFFGFDDQAVKVIPVPHLGGDEKRLMKQYRLS